MDYRQYYDLERYLLEVVGPNFRNSGAIEPIGFFSILVWKANRKKTHQRDRLIKKSGTFERAVAAIAEGLFRAPDEREQLRFLMQDWDFRLPTATAILTILYPEQFTVYDFRVGEEVGIKLANRTNFDSIWDGYNQFRKRVRGQAPEGFSLRDCDRYLWGHSWYKANLKFMSATTDIR
ncbi:hypothetical protein BLM14_02365 [Phyllobacterium zundukense]|nr:hypothetical protein BLM14_02365 [Phyllobacterium zundukense]